MRVRARVRACARASLADATRGLVKLAPDVACGKDWTDTLSFFRAKRVKIGPRERRRGSTAARARETWRAIRAERVPCGRFGWSASRSTRVSAPRARETRYVMLFPRFRDQTSTRKAPFSRLITCRERHFFLKGREAHHPGLEISSRSATREQSLVFVYRHFTREKTS